jgi:biotin transport system substrate-specific component
MSVLLTTRPTIIDRLVPRSIASDVALVAAGAALTALAAQVSIPTPIGVPFTLQTFAVLLVGASLGSIRGAASMALYALVGLLGLPVFAEQSHGASVLFGATGGFIFGFIIAGFVVGKLAELKWSSNILKMATAYAIGSIVIYLVGIPVLASVSQVDLVTATGWMVPFFIWDAVKAVAAGLALPGAWALLRKN